MKKVFGVCLVLLFCSTGLMFSQSRIISSKNMRCTSSVPSETSQSINYIRWNWYDDRTIQLVFYYYNGLPTEYLYLKNERNTGSGSNFDASFSSSQVPLIYNLTASMSRSGDYYTVFVYKSGQSDVAFGFTMIEQ